MKYFTSYWNISVHRLRHPPGIVVQFLGDVIHHVILRGFMGHGLTKLTGYQGLGHGLFAVLPKEQCHFLTFHKHGPHHQLMEGEREVVDFRVVQIDVHLFLSFACSLLAASAYWHVILVVSGVETQRCK